MNKLLNKIWTSSLDFDNTYNKKLLITTINANSFNIARKDPDFYHALLNSDILLPDGISIVLTVRFLMGQKIKRIPGFDLFQHKMEQLNSSGGNCFFLGSSEKVLDLIKSRAEIEYPNVKMNFCSPPFKDFFSKEDNISMISSINSCSPDVVFIGMTAPKQEKWTATHLYELNAKHICCIGAVFDFYAETIKRAPEWMIKFGMEWLYRLVREPGRMWRRYLIGNTKFIAWVLREKLKMNKLYFYL